MQMYCLSVLWVRRLTRVSRGWNQGGGKGVSLSGKYPAMNRFRYIDNDSFFSGQHIPTYWEVGTGVQITALSSLKTPSTEGSIREDPEVDTTDGICACS